MPKRRKPRGQLELDWAAGLARRPLRERLMGPPPAPEPPPEPAPEGEPCPACGGSGTLDDRELGQTPCPFCQ